MCINVKSISRYHKLKCWIDWLGEIEKEFPGRNTSIDTAIKCFESQLKELEK